MPCLLKVALGTALALGISTPALASAKPDTRVVECGAESCLVVTGRREHAASPVSLNGNAVHVQGRHKWRAVVPIETVRQWSAPLARSITIEVDGTTREARLPIGLLGHADSLAALVVRVR